MPLQALVSALLKGSIVTSLPAPPPRSPWLGLPAEQVKGSDDESCARGEEMRSANGSLDVI